MRYRLIESDVLNRWTCGVDGGDDVRQILEQEAATDPALDYRKIVILIFRWGTDPAKPVVKSCSGLEGKSPGVLVPAVYMGQYPSGATDLDGVRPVPSALLTHEFGHYMGLLHSHSNPVQQQMAAIRKDVRDNVKTQTEGAEDALDWLEKFQGPWDFDDRDGQVKGFPVQDTAIDLGPTFTLLQGPACGGNPRYVLDNDQRGQVTVEVDDRVRANAMGYWQCDPAHKEFSEDQVDRMHHVLKNQRSELRRRTFLCFLPDGPMRTATGLEERWRWLLPPLQRAPRPEERWEWLKWALYRWVGRPLGRVLNAVTGSRRKRVEIEEILPEWTSRDPEVVARRWLGVEPEEAVLEECGCDPPKRPHVWLVHGTWAHNILRARLWNWLRKWRPTRIAWPEMRSGLEAAGCVVHDFIWSGRNSHKERLAAGEDLALEIEKLRRASGERPKPRIFLVSHSHGGNVALYGAAKTSPPPDGIVCLATPFLHVEPLTLDTSAFKSLRGALAIVAGLATLTIWLIVGLDKLPNYEAITVLLGLAVAVLVGWAVGRLVPAVVSWFERAASDAADEARQVEPTPPDGPVLLLRKAGDEASAMLVTGQLGEWLATRIWKLLSTLLDLPNRLIELIMRRYPTFAATLVAAVVVGVIVASRVLDDEDLPWRILSRTFRVAIVAAVAVAALQALLGASQIVLSYARLGRGTRGTLLAPLLLKITTEAVPAGSHRLRVKKGSGTGGLAHSEIHHDKKVIAEIADWIMSI